MSKLDVNLDGLRCLVHEDQPAVFLCLNQQCQNSMRLYCQQCLVGEGDIPFKEVCLSQHLEDTLEVDSWSLNKCFQKIQNEFMKEDEIHIKSLLNYNQLRLEQLGRDTYRYLEERSYRDVPRVQQQLQQVQWNQESLEKFLEFQTSRHYLKEGIEALLKSSSNSEIDGNMEIEGGLEQLQAEKKQKQKSKLEAFKGYLDGMKNNLSKCQDILSLQETVVDKIDKQEIAELFEQIKGVIENFISKKTIMRNQQDSDSQPEEPDRVGVATRGSNIKRNSKIEDESNEESNEDDEEYKQNTNENRNKKKKQSKKDKKKKNKKTKKIEEQHKSQIKADKEVRIEPLSQESQQKTNIFTKLLMQEMLVQQKQQSQSSLQENENKRGEEEISMSQWIQKQSPKDQQTQEQREPQTLSQQTELSQDSQSTQQLQFYSQLSESGQKQLILSQDQDKYIHPQIEEEQEEKSSNQQETIHQQNQLDSQDKQVLQETIAQDKTKEINMNQLPSQLENINANINTTKDSSIDPNIKSKPQETQPLFYPKLEKMIPTINVQGKQQGQQQSKLQIVRPIQFPQVEFCKTSKNQPPISFQGLSELLGSNNSKIIKKTQITSTTYPRTQQQQQQSISGLPSGSNPIEKSTCSPGQSIMKNNVTPQQQQEEKQLPAQSVSSSSLINPIDTVSFPRDHKISRLILNVNSTMMIAVCGGWQKSSGKAFLVDVDHSQKKVIKMKKMFSSPQCQFTDGVFSLCDNYVCLAAQTGIHIFQTSIEESGEKQMSALFKIDTSYSIRSLIINPSRIFKNEKICYELILGGNLHFGIAQIEHTMKNPQIIQDLPVKGQIECIDFIAEQKYAVFTIFEQQILQCYDFSKNKIISSSKSFGFDPWCMQINQQENQIYVAGEDEFIHLFQFNPLRATISPLRKIKLYHNDIIISFAFHKDLLFIATSDYAFQVLQQNDEKQLEYTPFYFTNDKDHLMPNLTISAKHNCVYVASQLAKITAFQISEHF